MTKALNKISISIIIATCNREEILWESVKKASNAIKGDNVEIIVINDGDKPLTVPFPQKKNVATYENYIKGVSSARNFGVKNARGSILFFIDDDMWIDTQIIDWIDENLIQKKMPDAVYNINWEYPPSLRDKLKKNKIGRYILSSRYNTMWGRMNVKGKQPENGLFAFNSVASGSLILSKEVFNTIGGYNEAISFQGEDVDLANRINQLLIPIYCVFDTTLHHNHKDRVHLEGFLNRIGNGYYSQFLAERKGLIPQSLHKYHGANSYLFDTVLSTEKLWYRLHNFIPNSKFFEPMANRLTGLLSGLEKYKQWKKVFNQSNT